MSRTSKSIKNIKYAVSGQLFALIISFFTRMIFVSVLNAEYLGISGLFSNIMSILSFAELGIGSAIIYSMYKPLAEKDQDKIKALMYLYKQAYTIIGILIAISGIALMPFLDFFIKDVNNVSNLKLIYLMYLGNTSFSYFFSYKRSLIIADQKRYIDTLYHYICYFLRNILQIAFLVYKGNFLLYLIIEFVSIIAENILIAKKVDKLYPYLKSKTKQLLSKEDKYIIIKNIKALFLHKIGGVIVQGTDNLIISKFVGISIVGLYSNYLLIINALNGVFSRIFQALIASIGNLGVTESSEKSKDIFETLNLIGFWIYAFAAISLVNLFNPFIRLWLGEEYLFPIPIVIIVVLNFYLGGMRKSVLTFKDAFGLFWNDRYKPILEAAINLLMSLILVKSMGIFGVFLGTTISILTTCFIIEPYVLYKYGFKTFVLPYYIKYIYYTSIMILVGFVTALIASLSFSSMIINFIYRILVCAIIPNILFTIILWRKKEFQFLINKFNGSNKNKIGI